MSKPLLVGVDVHCKRNVFSVMDSHGQKVAAGFSVENNRSGSEDFVRWVAQQVVAGDFDAIQFG